MGPLFKPEDCVFVEYVSNESFRCGDCAVYLEEGKIFLHRVYSVSAGGLWLADDAGAMEKHFVPFGGVQGRVAGGAFFSSGWPGFIYGMSARSLRILKRRLSL